VPLEENFIEVGRRILELRAGLTQAEFASRLGVDRKSVVGWETGKRLPDGASLLRLMEQFGADVNYILSGKRSGGLSLSAEDTLMLQYFHEASPPVRKAALGALLSGSIPGSGMSMVGMGDGNVQIGGSGNNVTGVVGVKKGK